MTTVPIGYINHIILDREIRRMKTERWKAYKIVEICASKEDKHEYAKCILKCLELEIQYGGNLLDLIRELGLIA